MDASGDFESVGGGPINGSSDGIDGENGVDEDDSNEGDGNQGDGNQGDGSNDNGGVIILDLL